MIATALYRVIATLVFAAIALGAYASDENKITFQTSRFSGETISAYLSKPAGDGPFPAVILLHGCTGLERDSSAMEWRGLQGHAKFLNENGFVTLIVDSHGSRGISTADAWTASCVRGKGFRERTYDVYDALNFLEQQPFVARGKIALTGFSQGGSVIFNSMSLSEKKGRDRLVSAGVAFYPDCNYPARPTSYYAPILIIAGAKDEITPARECELLADLVKNTFRDKGSAEIELVVLPDVHHSFDLPLDKPTTTPIGIVAPDQGALQTARKLMLAFLKSRLNLE